MKIIALSCLSLLAIPGLKEAPLAQSAGSGVETVTEQGSSVTLPELSVSAPSDRTFFAPDTASQKIVTGREIEEQPRSRRGDAGKVSENFTFATSAASI